MLGNFNEEAQYILLKAREEMQELNHPYIGSEHLVLSILKNNDSISKKLKKYGLNYNNFKEEIINIIGKGTKKSEFFLYTPLLKKVIENSLLDAKDNNNGSVTPEHLLSSLLEEGEGIAIRLLVGMNIDIEEIYEEFSNKIRTKPKKNKKLLLNELGINLVEEARKNKIDPVEGREKEINRIIEILGRRCKNNPLLIGEAGVGKTAIVEWLAYLIEKKEVPINLQNKKIISLDMATLVAGTKYRGEFEERLQRIIKEIASDGEIILFIDEIHTLVGAGGAEGAIDASNILKPALARGTIKIIGATTTKEYKKNISTDKALSRRFQPVLIQEPTIEETINILNRLKNIYESYHHVTINNDIIKYIVELSNKYINNRHNPDKSLDILDEACSKVSIKETPIIKNINKLKNKLEEITKNKNSLIIENKLDKAYNYLLEESKIKSNINKLELEYKNNINNITKEDVRIIISEKTNIPLQNIEIDTIDNIQELNKELNNKIVGQENAINEIINYTKKEKLGYSSNKVKSFLFIGPTGVGKTALAKLYAKLVKGDLIRLDMSEYSDPTSINKIIGSSPGYVGYNDSNILDKIKDNPTSVILLDEIDKAHPNVLNLLYQMLDESIIKDSNNNIINLNNNTIIMTSNIGYNQSLGFNNKENNNDLKEVFNISLLNRIDIIVKFNKLNKDNITKIIINKLNNLKTKYKDFKYNNKLVEEIIKESNYEELGARKIDKIIESKLESIIIDNIINKKPLRITTIKEYINN